MEFALANPAHFQVMFTPTLFDQTHPVLLASRSTTFAELTSGLDSMSDTENQEDAAAAVIAAWALVHGIATLGLTGNLDASELRPLIAGGNLSSITRRSASLLYGSPRPGKVPGTSSEASSSATEGVKARTAASPSPPGNQSKRGHGH